MGERWEKMAGGDAGTSLPSPARGVPLDFNSVVTLGTELPLCCILGHCRFLLRGSLIIRISLYRYKTNKGADTQQSGFVPHRGPRRGPSAVPIHTSSRAWGGAGRCPRDSLSCWGAEPGLGGTQEVPGEGKAPWAGAGGVGESPSLTRTTGQLGRLPGAVLAAADDGRAARGEAEPALVARGGADLVALLWFAKGAGVAEGGGGPALHCKGGAAHCSQPRGAPPAPKKPKGAEGAAHRTRFPAGEVVGRPLFGAVGGAAPAPQPGHSLPSPILQV